MSECLIFRGDPSGAALALATANGGRAGVGGIYVSLELGRLKGLPWTAPAYDQLPVQGVPELFCMAVDDGRCTCHTEQGTKYEVEAGVCRSIARDGIYNPFRKPLDRETRRPERERQEAPAAAPVAVVGDAGGYWPKTGIPQDYSPPQHQIATGMN